MRAKRFVIVMIALTLLVVLAGCSQKQEEAPTAESNYNNAIGLLQEGKYAEAASEFTGLGHYYDASRYAMYCNALASAEKGDYALAASSMKALEGFSDSSVLYTYYTGRAYEEAELYEKALEQYALILQYGDATARAGEMPGKAQERDYKAACAFEQEGNYKAAISAFEALNGYADSDKHISSIRGILAEQERAKAYEEAAALEKAEKLEAAAEAFRALGDYSDSKTRASAIKSKIVERDYQKALELEQGDDLVSAYTLYVALGEYKDAADRAAAIREEASYRSALAMVDEGKYTQARKAYADLGDYKDSAEKARLLGVCEIATSVRYLNSGVVAFELQDSWGYIDLINNYDVSPAYDSIAPFSEKTDLAVVSSASGKTVYYGLINRQGTIVAADAYMGIRQGENGYYTAVKNGKGYAYNFVLISPEGAALSEWRMLGNSVNSDATSKWNEYTLSAPVFTNGVMIAMDSNNEYCLLNNKGEVVIKDAMSIELIRRKTANDTVLVDWGRKGYQLLSLDGKALDDHLWYSVAGFSNGFAAVCSKDNLWGYISQEDCRVVIEPQYNDAAAFSDGYAGVKVKDAWGYIDAQNNMIIAPQYRFVTGFNNNMAVVNDGQLGWQVIDTTGKLLYFKQNVYMSADTLDKAGEYESAIAAFESLEGYADSGERALQAREKVNAEIYASAVQLEREGKYIEAAEVFEWLGDYSDAPARAEAARETQNALTYAKAEELEKKGKREEAIAVYLTLGDYRGSAQHAADLREAINQDICKQADELEAGEKYEAAIKVLNQIPDYTGVAEHIASLEEKIRLRDYNAAAALEEAGKYEEAIEAFKAMGDYSDSAERITAIQEKIKERDYNAAAALEEAGKYEEAIEAFTVMGDYSDSAERITAIQGKIKERDYNAAAALEEAGNYLEAYDAFISLGEYSDSASRATAVLEKAEEQKRENAYAAAAEAEEKGDLETAASGFEALGTYKDSAARLDAVQEKIKERDYHTALEALKSEEYSRAVKLFTALGDYKDSAELLLQAQLGVRYQKAVADALAGKLSEAYSQFVDLGDYKDSAKKAEICGNLSRASRTQEITAGVLIYDFHEAWGIANLNTNVITAAKYTSIEYDAKSYYANYGLLLVYLDNKNDTEKAYGYIDHNGKEVIPCIYIKITDFNGDGNCTCASWAGTKYQRFLFGIRDYTGKVITESKWRTMGSSYNTSWTSSYYSSVYLSNCKISLPVFTDGRMMVQDANGHWGFIDVNGKVLGEVKWYSVGDFSDGMAMVCEYVSKARKYGFINEKGQTIGEVRWDEVKAFSNGYAAVREGDFWGFINKNNELMIPCQYIEVAAFKDDGTCDVKTKDGRWQVINKEGEVSFF